MKKIIIAVAAFLLLFIFNINTAFAEETKPLKEWTMLTFINGHNNLSMFGGMNIKQMEEVGSTDDVNLVVQWGAFREPTKRLYIEKSTNPAEVTSPVVMEMPAVDFGDHKELMNFIRWGVENYPAKRYFINVWNHGNGWRLFNGMGAIKPMDISYDDLSGNHITTEQLGLVMAEAKQLIGHNVDLYGSDACLMAMAEVAAEMSESVDYYVGSQELEPGEGWPYATFLNAWFSSGDHSPANVAKTLSAEFLKAYSPGGIYPTYDVTFSAYNLSAMPRFYEELQKFVTSVMNLSDANFTKVREAVNPTQYFYYSDYRDLGDFLRHLDQSAIVADDQPGLDLAGIQGAVSELVIANDVSQIYKDSSGLSLWLPTSSWIHDDYRERYKGLILDQKTSWSQVLERLHK